MLDSDAIRGAVHHRKHLAAAYTKQAPRERDRDCEEGASERSRIV